MDLTRAIGVAAAGLKAQAGRMRIIAENLANADSAAKAPGEDPYRRKVPTLKSAFDDELSAQVVRLGRVERDRSDFRVRREPGNPLADANGDVRLPNVDPLIEQMDMREAQRSYQANLNMVGAARKMIVRTLDILRA
ncbi:flagellar basal body rod protein FlgC [Hansschlegelia beijingensis]|uniref:Flagellar basal-body rod protein FlgC n=1 Tax=Hansschlegelia beijingensis TaxID=1133344 RepID=A0A7W6D3C4_9HYPH|nr:flagellar basal body rod protein FlgC [Hansschlegelia beijingensis]MBB3973545.1 flagellar basal-body rod protein FlgC [Hansschlegelia beijingensis]